MVLVYHLVDSKIIKFSEIRQLFVCMFFAALAVST